MLERAIFTLTFAAAIGSGVVGGIFYAFSSFVMAALGSLPSTQGAGAMKAINVTVINPVFMLAFMGTAVLGLVLAGASLIWWGRPGGMLIVAASLLYLSAASASPCCSTCPEQSARRGRARAGSSRLVTLSRCLDGLESCPHDGIDPVGDPVHRRDADGLRRSAAPGVDTLMAQRNRSS